jgi:hypothetical protein
MVIVWAILLIGFGPVVVLAFIDDGANSNDPTPTAVVPRDAFGDVAGEADQTVPPELQDSIEEDLRREAAEGYCERHADEFASVDQCLHLVEAGEIDPFEDVESDPPAGIDYGP